MRHLELKPEFYERLAEGQSLESKNQKEDAGNRAHIYKTHGGFIADATFDYMLMHLAFYVDDRLADSAGDPGGTPTVRAGQG